MPTQTVIMYDQEYEVEYTSECHEQDNYCIKSVNNIPTFDLQPRFIQQVEVEIRESLNTQVCNDAMMWWG